MGNRPGALGELRGVAALLQSTTSGSSTQPAALLRLLDQRKPADPLSLVGSSAAGVRTARGTQLRGPASQSRRSLRARRCHPPLVPTC